LEELIDIDLIDVNDQTFRVSRNASDNILYDSINNNGMLEKPFLVKIGERYIPLNCHKRIKICCELQIKKINSIVLSSPDAGLFFNNLVLKLYRNEVGPAGRLKALSIMESHFPSFIDINSGRFRKIIGIPGEYIDDSVKRERVMGLPSDLLDYLDTRDVSFKVIKDIAAMGRDVQELISSWTGHLPIRINIFKKLVDHVFDISRREGVESLRSLNMEEISEDSILYEEIFKIRYPVYSSINKCSAELVDKIKVPGLSVDFPEFLERDYITLKLNISKRSGSGEWREILSRINDEQIQELIDIL
jgi:hypothetical protein